MAAMWCLTMEPAVMSAVADELRLVDDSIVRGTIVKRIGSNLVFEVERSGVREIYPPAILKAIRVTGSESWITPGEFFGDGSGAGDEVEAAPDERSADLPRMAARLLRVDLPFDSTDADHRALVEEFFDEVATESPDAIVVLVGDVSMSIEAANALAGHLRRLEPSVIRLVGIEGRTSNTVLPLLEAATRVAWLPDGQMKLGTGVPGTPQTFRRLSRCIGEANVERLLSGTPLAVDVDGSLVEGRGGRGLREIDADLAVRCGLADIGPASSGSKDLGPVIDRDAIWRFAEHRLAVMVARNERDELKAAQQLTAALDAAREIGEYATSVRSEAIAFDELYEEYRIDLVWRREKEWRTPDHKLRSVRQQREVRDAIRGMTNATARLKTILSRLPADLPERSSLERCLAAGTAAVAAVREYDSSLQRNADQKYEATRARAKGLRVGGC
jgi:hypothetical protein